MAFSAENLPPPSFLSVILIAISTGVNTDVIYLDYSRAFDSVVHSKLIAKLEHYGVGLNPVILAWVSSFLVGRVQCVRVGSSFSNFCDIVSGVPQGSVLGPILFVIFVNEICNLLHPNFSLKLFADDVKLYSTVISNSDAVDLQRCLHVISAWSDAQQLNCSLVNALLCILVPGEQTMCLHFHML